MPVDRVDVVEEKNFFLLFFCEAAVGLCRTDSMPGNRKKLSTEVSS